MSIGWDTLNAAKLGEIREEEFEQLCRDLLDVERADRHDLRSELVGPSAPRVADGGRDLVFSVKAALTEDEVAYAKRYALVPLTPDEGRRAYSCKTGATWQRKVLEEARTKSEAVIPILRDKGSLFIFVNVPFVDRDGDRVAKKRAKKNGTAKKKASKQAPSAPRPPLVEQLAQAYAARMPGGPTESELKDRIRILDANELHRFLQARRPVLSAPMQRALGLVPVPGLLDIEAWGQFHAVDRPPAPEFVFDALRGRIRDQIVDVLTSRAPDPYDRALWIVGPPGIGKTRLVLEALRKDPRLERRALVAPSYVEGLRAVREEGVFQQFHGVVLVIDDCPAHEADAIAPFVTKLGQDAALIVLTPHAPELLPPGGLRQRIEVEPLGRDETAEIIRQKLGAAGDPEDAHRLASLSEGYPWFAALVAAEVAKGAPAPKTVADAADLALASRREEGGRFVDIVIERARALFAVMLTEDIDWAELDDEKRRALHEAVDAPSWEALEKAKRACEQRKLLRVRAAGKFKYVTPEILAREVARKLLTPPPGGPSPIGPRLLRGREWSARLYERLDRLGLSVAELRALAGAALARADEAPPGLALLGPSGLPQAALLIAARHLPRETAARLRSRIEEVPFEALRERREVRRALVFALERVARCEGCFDDAERALFRLAVAENEVYGNNATHVWASLFLVPLNITKSPWEERIARLRERCADGSAEARRTALAGVGAAVSTQGAVTRPDGEKADAWSLLIACAQDEDTDVAREAGKLASRWLRGAVREGILERFAAALAAAVPRFDEASRRGVREALEHVRVYEGARVRGSAGLTDALRRIEEAAAPRSFSERLRQQVGAWGPAAERSEDDAQDVALIREGLSPPARPLLAELDWLLSPAAVRSMSFAIALGRTDVDGAALGPLVERTRTGRQSSESAARTSSGAEPLVLSRYLLGMDDAGRGDDVDALLAKWGDDDRALIEAAAIALPRLHPSGERPAYLARAVDSSLVSERALLSLTWHRWAEQLGSDALAALLAALLGQPSAAAATAALELILDRIDAKPDGPDLHRPLLQAMKRLSSEPLAGMPAYAWERGGKRLLLAGAAQEACDVAITGVLTGEMASEHHWLMVHACEEQAPAKLWEAVRAVLERGGPDAMRLVVKLRWRGVGARFPVPSVLLWVGRDRGRASLVAEFAPVHGDELPGVARGLISRFGAESAPAHALAAAVGSTFKAVHSLAEHDRKQLGRVQRWRADPDAEVRRWAALLARSLERSAELHTAYEEHEHRRFGT